MNKLTAPAITKEGKAAVIGGGPAGMAAAYFLRRAGMAVTVFEKNDALGGVVRHVIPEFRIPGTSIDKDAALLEKMGVEVRLNTEVKDTAALKAEGFTTVILAVGASEPGVLRLEQGEAKNALEFLADFKANDGKLDIGKLSVVVTQQWIQQEQQNVQQALNMYILYTEEQNAICRQTKKSW